jgi:NADPH2:quinone reductase
MKAVEIHNLEGPDKALRVAELPAPEPGPDQVLVEVHAIGVSFPEVLQTRGLYQFKPELPFVPGSEVGGLVRSAPADSGFKPGDRVAAFTMLGAFAELAVAATAHVATLPDSLDLQQGAALILNYHTAWFSLVTRGRLKAGERVLVHGAAGGVGTASLQVAKGLGAETVAVVSTDAKEQVAVAAGADHVLRSDGDWREGAKALGGIDVVIDPVGGDRFTDSIRSLRIGGRVVVVGFTEGSIPEVKVNRLLLGNTEIVGAGWGAYALARPQFVSATTAEIAKLIAAGFVSPIIGAAFPLERAAEALNLIDSRGATGKIVLDLT